VTVRVSAAAACDVTAYGAVGDGVKNDTKAIQNALDDARCGTVLLAGNLTFLVAALRISRSHTELRVVAGATLLVSDDRGRWPGERDVITASGVSHVAITGGGTVDGQGLVWWRNREAFRPRLVYFHDVSHALLRDTLYLDAPNHVLELYCDFCELARVRVLAPPSTGADCESRNACSHNTDAVDIHGSPFFVHGVNFTTGDDNIAAHANDTIVEDSYFGTGHGASIGSLCDVWLRNITFRNISFHGTTAGARIKSRPKCGGRVWDVTYEALTMRGVETPIDLTQFYDGLGASTMRFENIVFKDIQVYGGESEDGGSGAGGGGGGGGGDAGAAVQFDCDDHFDGQANCQVVLDNVQFNGYGKGGAKMTCQGTTGTADQLSGINNCL
jgi:hypothetical protein